MSQWPRFLKTNLAVLIISNAASAINFASQIFLTRRLGAAEFGAYAAVSSISVVVFSFFGVIPSVIARAYIDFEEDSFRQRNTLKTLNLFFISLGVLSTLFLLLAAPAIASRLQITNANLIRIFSFQLTVKKLKILKLVQCLLKKE
ncbi:MAG: hypothetical protein EOP06_08450 [Proteobacteria bacterium]|nr:MAG: hypothetical protein EOP06_08450 [Pseudomonadota bacterium]